MCIRDSANVGCIPSYHLPTDGREITCYDGWSLFVDAGGGSFRQSDRRDKAYRVLLNRTVPSLESLKYRTPTIT